MPFDYSREELVIKWEEFFAEYGYEATIISIADRYPEERSLEVKFVDLDRYDTDLAIYLLEKPDEALSAAEEAVRSLVPPTEGDIAIHVRITGLSKDSRVRIRDLRSKHLGNFIAVEGLVRKATEVRPKMMVGLFECMRCHAVVKEPQEGPVFREPLECYKEQGGCERTASSTKFRLLSERSEFLDTQKIEIQEAPEGLRGGEQPQRLEAYLEDDICGMTSPGDRVVLNGVLRSRQRGRFGRKSTLFDVYLEINSIETQQVEFEEIELTEEDIALIRKEAESEGIFRKIVASIAPTIYGLPTEKEALALQLFGGVPKVMPDGTRLRGDIHILLVGDPGTGKSAILTYMSQLAPRGIYATGRSATAAGLTAAAVRDEFGEGRWTLEAGALVLADKGLVLIDEIDKMDPQDRSSIHTAMEQQVINISKAGIQASLPTRCAVLGAANPKFGRFDEHKYLSEQIDLPPTLLSRFDMIFTFLDRPESSKDRRMADHILRGHVVGEMKRRETAGMKELESTVTYETYEPFYPPEFLRKYVAYAKRLYPVMVPETIEVLREKYLEIRKQGELGSGAVPITPRQLEAFVRLAEASARARLSEEVTVDDAERAVRIMEYWLRKVTGEEGGALDIDIITTGVSHSQREQIIALRDIIEEVADEEGTAAMEDIIALAQERGMSVARVESWIQRWKRDGELYSPARGRVKLVRPT